MDFRHDKSNLRVRSVLTRAVEAGAENGCPFCIGRQVTHISRGDRIVLLKGRQAGRIGTCTNDVGFTGGEFLVRFEDQIESYETTISYSRDEFMLIPPPKLPKWIAPLSIDDNNYIENEAINIIVEYHIAIKNGWKDNLIFPLAHKIWWRRLPIDPEEVWFILDAHGAPTKIKRRFVSRLDTAVCALRYCNGRAAIKSKRMAPFQVGAYMTANQTRLFNLINSIAEPN